MPQRVKMLRTVPVSPDGLRTETWHEGREYPASDRLVEVMIDMGAVELVEGKKPKRKRKAKGPAPENKARV